MKDRASFKDSHEKQDGRFNRSMGSIILTKRHKLIDNNDGNNNKSGSFCESQSGLDALKSMLVFDEIEEKDE